MEINEYLREYERDFGKVENLEDKIEEIKSRTFLNNEIFLSEEVIRKDLEEKGLKNQFLQDTIIFKYFGEVHHFSNSVYLNLLEKTHILYEFALGAFGDDIKDVLKREPAELFKEKVGRIDNFPNFVIYHLLVYE